MGYLRREESLSAKLREQVSEKKQKYIMYKLGMINDDWDTVSKRYLNGQSLFDVDNKYKTEEDVQKAMKYALKVLHIDKMIQLYNIYFEKAKEDTQAFRAFVDFSESFFKDEQESELLSILSGVDVDEFE